MASPLKTPSWQSLSRYLTVLLMGFASGLPLALTGVTLQAWLVSENIDIATIGFFGLIGLPYTFKFIWAPLMDRFELPFFGRRRGWLLITQLAIAGVLFWMASLQPGRNTIIFALVALLVAFLSASQDVVIDAYRTDLLPPNERGLGASFTILGYRLAMILSGGIAFIWADTVSGNGWSWSTIYRIMGIVMLVMAGVSMLLVPRLPKHLKAPETKASHDLIGFAALVLAVVVGYQITYRVISPGFYSLFDVALAPGSKKWADLCTLLCGVAITLPLGWQASRLARFETLNRSIKSYFSQKKAFVFLVLIILYKLGDAFAGALLNPFLLGIFSKAEVGVVNKVFGIWLTILGALVGGSFMMRIGLYRALMGFGILQLLSNIGFWLVAISPKGAWGSMDIPAFHLGIVMLKEATQVDLQLLMAIAFENLAGGMGTAALLAFLMALCNQKFTATQFSLLSALASIGRVWVGPFSGVLVTLIGWPKFFLVSAIAALPGLLMLAWLRQEVNGLEAAKVGLDVDD